MIYITNNIVHFPRNSKEDVVLLHLVNQLTQSVIDVEVTNTSTNGKIYTFDISSAIAKMVAGQYDYFLYTTDSKLVGSGILQVDNYKTEDITYNVNYDIIQYSPDEEEVVVPLRKLTIIENGEYDVTNVDEVIVNVNQNEDKIEALEANIGELEALNLGLTNSFNSANSTIEELEGDISNLNQRISYLNEDINGLNDNINQLTTQRNNLQTQVDNLTSQNENLSALNEGYVAQIATLDNEISALQRQVSELQREVVAQIETIEGLNLTIESLTEELQKAEVEISDKSNQITNQTNQINTLQREVVVLTERVEILEKYFGQTGQQLINRIEDLEAQVEELQTQIEELQREVVDKQEEIETLNTENETLTVQVSELETQVNSLQTEIVGLNTEISTLTTEVGELTNENETLTTEVGELTTEVAEKQTYIDTATSISITENGTYTPEEGVVGYNEIVVDVEGEIVNTQEKSVEYTENGTYTVVPDDGYYLTGVNVDVNVEGGEESPLPDVDNPDNYFYIQTTKGNNTIYFSSTVSNTTYDITSHRSKLEYSYDGSTWTSLDGVSSLPLGQRGDCLFLRNVSTTNITCSRFAVFTYRFSLFGAALPVKVGGNVQKLLSNYANPTSVSYSYVFGKVNPNKSGAIYDNIIDYDVDMPNGTSLAYAFQLKNLDEDDILPIESLNIGGDTSTVTNFSYMFNDCSSLTEVPLFDTSNGTSFSTMFYGCSSLTTIPSLDLSNGTSFGAMFAYCNSLTEVPTLNVSNGTSFGGMFSGCLALENITFEGSINATISFVNSPLLTEESIKSILTACSNTTNTDAKTLTFANIALVGEEFVTLIETCASKGWTISGLVIIEEPAVEESEYFYIKALNPLKTTYLTLTETSYLYNSKSSYEFSFDTITWMDMKVSQFGLEEGEKVYIRCKEDVTVSGAYLIDSSDYILFGGKAITLVSTDNTLSGFNNLLKNNNKLIYSHCDLSNSSSLDYTFSVNRNLICGRNFGDTSNCTDFNYMFNDCTSLSEITQLDTSNGTDFIYMFNDCTSLTKAPIIDTSKGINLRYMFNNCTSLTEVPTLNLSNGTSIAGMFLYCSSLENITFEGSINGTLYFGYCPLLTYDSVKSILTACSNTTNTSSKTLTFSQTLTDNNGELAALVETCTSKGWTILGLTLE